MWKCVMCETNNPDNSEDCFICDIRREDSLRMFNEMKMREADIKTFFPTTVASEETEATGADVGKSDIFGKAVYERAYYPDKSYDPPPPVYAPEDYWDDKFMDYAGHRKTGKEKRLEKMALKEKYRLEGKIYRSKGEKIFLCILLALVASIFAIVAISLIKAVSEPETDSYSSSEIAYTESNNIDNSIGNNAENTISKDVLKCFA